MRTIALTPGPVGLLVVLVALSSCDQQPKVKDLIVQSNVEMTETNINSQIAGRVKAVAVKEGDQVRQGQALIAVDSDTLNAQLLQAKARLQSTKAQRESAAAAKELAQASYQRLKQMWDKGAITKAEFDDVSAKQRQAVAGLESLDAQLEVAQGALLEITSYLDKAAIAAPADGVITQVNVEAGELISTGMPLVVITDKDSPWIQCSVRETNLSKVRLGQKVSVTFPAYKGEVFAGQVVRINKDADFAVKRATNDNGEFDVLSYGVKVELTGVSQPLYSGMTAFVNFGQ